MSIYSVGPVVVVAYLKVTLCAGYFFGVVFTRGAGVVLLISLTVLEWDVVSVGSGVDLPSDIGGCVVSKVTFCFTCGVVSKAVISSVCGALVFIVVLEVAFCFTRGVVCKVDVSSVCGDTQSN